MARTTSVRWAAALLVSALVFGPASAIYIETPLALEASDREVEAGDVVVFQVRALSGAEPYAGATVRVVYAFDANETGEGPDGPTDSASFQERVLLDRLVLGAKADGTFEWTVPAEVDGRNVDVIILSQGDERLAFEYLAVGDAPPQMRIMAGSGPAGGPEPHLEDADGQDAADGSDRQADARESVPGAGVLGVLALLGGVALLRRR